MTRPRREALTEQLERRQIVLYLAALAVGAIVGLAAPGSAPAMEDAINPTLALVLYATFLGIPFASITRSLEDTRFLGGALLLNFVLVPIVVFGLTRFIASHDALLVGALLVLLCPCIDYVIVFTRIAGGAHERLLAAAPLLMLLQMLLLPVYLLLFVGSDLTDIIEVDPFVEALLILIVIPLAAAALTQAIARTTVGKLITLAAQSAMVPLMMIVLAVVVGSQISDVKSELSSLLGVAAIYAAFLVVMAVVGAGLSRLLQLDTPGSRALTFSGATRNSLVVLHSRSPCQPPTDSPPSPSSPRPWSNWSAWSPTSASSPNCSRPPSEREPDSTRSASATIEAHADAPTCPIARQSIPHWRHPRRASRGSNASTTGPPTGPCRSVHTPRHHGHRRGRLHERGSRRPNPEAAPVHRSPS